MGRRHRGRPQHPCFLQDTTLTKGAVLHHAEPHTAAIKQPPSITLQGRAHLLEMDAASSRELACTTQLCERAASTVEPRGSWAVCRCTSFTMPSTSVPGRVTSTTCMQAASMSSSTPHNPCMQAASISPASLLLPKMVCMALYRTSQAQSLGWLVLRDQELNDNSWM